MYTTNAIGTQFHLTVPTKFPKNKNFIRQHTALVSVNMPQEYVNTGWHGALFIAVAGQHSRRMHAYRRDDVTCLITLSLNSNVVVPSFCREIRRPPTRC